MRRPSLRLVAPVLALALAGCRNDMHRQAKIRPFRESTFFPDGASARPLPEGVVARGFLRDDAALYRGQGPDGKFVERIPVPLTRALLLRGQERFDIFCSPCHGRTGEGQGMIVQRGFKRPPSYHIDRLRAERAGYFFDVVTNGFGQMSGYAAQVPPDDRWAIVAWVRTLQASQHMPGEFLDEKDKTRLDRISRMPDVKGLGPQSGAQSAPLTSAIREKDFLLSAAAPAAAAYKKNPSSSSSEAK
jgi:mono/diheme cytochrome c family protein